MNPAFFVYQASSIKQTSYLIAVDGIISLHILPSLISLWVVIQLFSDLVRENVYRT